MGGGVEMSYIKDIASMHGNMPSAGVQRRSPKLVEQLVSSGFWKAEKDEVGRFYYSAYVVMATELVIH